MKSLSRVRLFETPWTAAHQAPPSMGFSSEIYLTNTVQYCLYVEFFRVIQTTVYRKIETDSQILKTNYWLPERREK